MPSVMIVDDSVVSRSTMKTLLKRTGCTVIAEAENGIEAVEKYSAYEPDIVFMDIVMPVMDGLTALRKIKMMDKNAVVVVVSSMDDQQSLKKAILGGAREFIAKPYDPEKFINTVLRLRRSLRLTKSINNRSNAKNAAAIKDSRLG